MPFMEDPESSIHPDQDRCVFFYWWIPYQDSLLFGSEYTGIGCRVKPRVPWFIVVKQVFVEAMLCEDLLII